MGSKKPQLAPTVPRPENIHIPPAPPCVHKFVFVESIQKTEQGADQTRWIGIDRFFCEKCLEGEMIKKEEWGRDPPDWWTR